jgi:hypothetical protein
MINNVHILYSSYSHSFMVIHRGSMLMLVFFWDFFDLRICITCIYTLTPPSSVMITSQLLLLAVVVYLISEMLHDYR